MPESLMRKYHKRVSSVHMCEVKLNSLFFQARQQFAQKLIDLIVFDPTHNHDEVIVGIAVNNIGAVSGVNIN